MNRIREIDGIYQVLITPTLDLAPDMELMIGNWEDKNLKGFRIKEFDNLQDAYYYSAEYPDINWVKLVRMHKDFYNIIGQKVRKILDSYNFTYNIETRLIEPKDLKATVFKRVINEGSRFSLTYNLNDVVSVVITNPWYSNLLDMEKALKGIRDLRVRKIIKKGKIISLVGSTDLGTMYEIKLIPSLIHHTLKWQDKHKVYNKKIVSDMYKTQKLIDSGEKLG